MFLSSPPDIVETSGTTEIHYSMGKTLYYLAFGAIATCIAAFMTIAIWQESGAQGAHRLLPVLLPVIFLCIFASMFLFYLVRFARLNRPPVIIGPDGVFDERCVTAPIPWSQIRRVLKRTRSVNKGRLHYVVLHVDETALRTLRSSKRRFHRYNKFWGYGDVALLASNLTGSHRRLLHVVEAYARAYGAPAARDWE
ncbi:STM3941 family protein [Labrenzia sp. VG12]|uniref:STM3941 family protein n=1 Tax=Labrenzia sp. VG12 TaxID=2021862 RepID=UPI000B8BFB54|nr:STM3941 family protein [Labrenzia sp. VG12]ASP33460.1 hypothetical protein CHH27_09550 [Labrenzia sp. VG12]